MIITVYIDGLSEPTNPGVGTYGYLLFEGKRKLAEGDGLAGYEVTNNYAEYAALVEALKKVNQLSPGADVVIRSDSKLLVEQMSGRWKVKGGGYIAKLREAKSQMEGLGSIMFEWIPREQNSEADLLSRVAYERFKPQ